MNTIREHLNQAWRRPTGTCVSAVAVIMALMNPVGPPAAFAQEACCFLNGTCTDVLPADCATAGGTARGAGTTCATVICPASTDCSAPALAIPDNNSAGIDDTITVADSATIADLNVYLRADHTFVGDLIFTLEHVDTGTTVVIYDRPGAPPGTFGCGQDDLEIILDDEALSPIEGVCNPAAPAQFGSFMPNNPLAAFDGEDKSGMWTLNVSDNAGADTGTLIEWCLIFDTDNDGVPDAADACPGFDDNLDADGDTVPDGCDLCVGDDATGDSDGDGICDDFDDCPSDANKVNPGACGCGVADDDSDGDGVPDCFDGCPNDPNKLQPGLCGCGNVDVLNAPCAPPAGQATPDCCGGGMPMMMPLMLMGWKWGRRRSRRRGALRRSHG
jgi:subtilisin-like proprotein convertase family protein